MQGWDQLHHLQDTLGSCCLPAWEFSTIPAVLLSATLSRLEHFADSSYRSRTLFSTEQVTALLTSIKESDDVTLKSLEFLPWQYRGVSPDLLSEAVIKVERVNLDGCNHEQVEKVFRKIVDSGSAEVKTKEMRTEIK